MSNPPRLTNAFEVVPNRYDMPSDSVTINVTKFTSYHDQPYQTLNLTISALEALLKRAKANETKE